MLAMAERKLTCGLEAGLCPVFLSFFLLWRGRFAGKFQPEAFFENVFRFYFFFAFERMFCNRLQIKRIKGF